MTPHVHAVQVPPLTPVEVFSRLARCRDVVWLDSSLERLADGRFSIMACEPEDVFIARGQTWELRRGDGTVESANTAGSLDALDQWLDQRHVVAPPEARHLPFVGGAVGWLAYDLGRQFEIVDGTAIDDLAIPDIRLAWYNHAVVWDHAASAMWLVGLGPTREEALAAPRRWLEASSKPIAPPPTRRIVALSDTSQPIYLRHVDAVRDGIARGEYYQLNLVQRFACPPPADPAATYLQLRAINPAPFSAYVSAGSVTVLSSSPERFVEISPDGTIRTCPIKGTRPRAADAGEDEARQAELLSSAKERAELLMIVDLLRNDLGRVCESGSVRVERLHALESFATVHHLVGEITGRMRPATKRRDWLRAIFPGGSITGAPKVSAMRAIDRLEPHRRGIAMGSIGYFSAHGRTDLNIAIRTIVTTPTSAYVAVGAGIVWDSQPAAEYEETLAKARALFEALGVEGREA